MQSSLIGRSLGNFRILRLIGSGGMAQVYYGEDTKLNRPVAIKIIDERYRDLPVYTENFLREARTVASWRHENIVQIYYADDDNGLYYFVMEYINGMDLATLMEQYGQEGELLPHDDVIHVGRAIARALDYAHKRNVVHRDVKPANVLVARDGRVVLTDFGLAAEIESASSGSGLIGTAHYIAPEQARRANDATPRSDVYAFGVILYEMLTGVVPFDDPSPAKVALQHINLQPPPPQKINPSLSDSVETVLLKALEKKPENRYATATLLMDALEEALAFSVQQAAEIPELPPMPAGVKPPANVKRVSRKALLERVITQLEIRTSSQATIPLSSLPISDKSALSNDTAPSREAIQQAIEYLQGLNPAPESASGQTRTKLQNILENQTKPLNTPLVREPTTPLPGPALPPMPPATDSNGSPYAPVERPRANAETSRPRPQTPPAVPAKKRRPSRLWWVFGFILLAALIVTGLLAGYALKLFPVTAPTLTPTQTIRTETVLQLSPSPTQPPATVTHTASPAPSKTATNSPSPTRPNVSPSPTPTKTAAPPSTTPTRTGSPTPIFTATPTPTPTDTAIPTATFTAAPTLILTPTPLYPNGAHFKLFYNETSFYLLNLSVIGRNVEFFDFIRINANGKITDRFRGEEWSKYYANINPNTCMSIEVKDAEGYLKPPECNRTYVSARFPTATSGYVFWNTKEGSAYFRVMWRDQQIAICEIAAGVCDVYLP